MAPFPVFTKQDLADFSGRPLADYPPFAESGAIPQAVLLFKLSTGLSEFPDTLDMAQLARFAIEELAEQFVLSQPHREIIAQPFSSETIGSYTYQKAAKVLQAGQPLGLLWFDLAVQRLGVSEDVAGVFSGSLSLFDRDLEIVYNSEGGKVILGPGDKNQWDDAAQWSVSRPVTYDPNRG
jgi:hypothetical protein